MDKIDKSIIMELSSNSKKTLKELSNSLPISKQGVNLRVENLIKNQIISLYALINYFNIGKNNTHLHIKFEKLTLDEINVIIEKLMKRKSIGWVAETFHEYDISISITYINFKIVENVISLVKKLSKNRIKKIDYLNIKESYYFSFNCEDSKIARKIVPIKKTVDNPIKLKAKEKEIVKMVSQNGRFKLTDLGIKTNLTPNSVKYIISELEKKGVILSYCAFIDYIALGYKWYEIIIETYIDDDFLQRIFPFQNIVFLSKTKEGKVIVDYIAKNVIQVRNFVNELEEIIGRINNYEIYEIVKIPKLDNSNKQD